MNPLQSAITQALSDVESFSRLAPPARSVTHVILCAAVYLDAWLNMQVNDGSGARGCADWASIILAGPLPTHAETMRHKAQPATKYAAAQRATSSTIRHSAFSIRQLP
ncbi:MAG TPA: hypothetical protein VGK81_05985 [Anaerolineae bacterium]